MYYYYNKCMEFIKNANTTTGLYDGVRAILQEAIERSTMLKDLYPEDYLIKRIQRAADARYIELGGK